MRTRVKVLLGSMVAAGALVTVGCGGDSSKTSTATTSSSTGPSSSTSSTSSTSPVAAQPATAVWPFAAEGIRYDRPEEAARTFAVTYLGFVDPVVGPFQQGDSRSGEIEIRADAKGPATVVFVRQLTADNSWWVLGASTPNLSLSSPTALVAITSPVTLSGQSTAFEATVNVQIRQDGRLAPLKEDIVMGGSNGEMGPFSKAIDFPEPAAPAGAIVLETLSAKDGHVWEAGVVRVSFGG